MKLSGWVGVALVAVFWIGVISWFLNSRPFVPPILAAGQPAPDFVVQDATGKRLHLSDFKGRTVVLDYWATWYRPCDDDMPQIDAAAKTFKDKNVTFLLVDVWDKRVVFLDWVSTHPSIKYVVLAFDPRKEGKDVASVKYDVSQIPTQFIINKNGIVEAALVNGALQQITTAVQKSVDEN